MALRALKTTDFKDKDIVKFQENVAEFLNQLNATILNGLILSDIIVGTTDTDIPHMLGRTYSGWQLIDLQGDARVWRETASVSDKSKFLTLKASSQVTVSLWVF